MKINIKPIKKEEEKYLFSMRSHDVNMRCGAVGYLRGDFGINDNEFFTTWFDICTAWKSDAFSEALGEVMRTLRISGVLNNRADMQRYVHCHPDYEIKSAYCQQYAFRVDGGERFVFLVRCNPVKGDYNFYIYCFVKPWFDQHLARSANGIRFIDQHYNELFRIEDGGKIEIVYPDGEIVEHECWYIDDYHVFVGSASFHICEFAEKMEAVGATVRPLTA